MRYFGSKSSTVEAVVGLALDRVKIWTAADTLVGLGVGAAPPQRNIRTAYRKNQPR